MTRRDPGPDWADRPDWKHNRTCQLCGRELPHGEWGYADGPLCHPDDPNLPDCYHLWTVYGKRPVDEEQARQRAEWAQQQFAVLTGSDHTAIEAVQRLITHARKISAGPAMSLYVTELELALGLIAPDTPTPHKLGGNDD
jgi:hypothetical protein